MMRDVDTVLAQLLNVASEAQMMIRNRRPQIQACLARHLSAECDEALQDGRFR